MNGRKTDLNSVNNLETHNNTYVSLDIFQVTL